MWAAVLLVPVLLYFSAYLKSGEPLQCLWRGDGPYELYRQGVKNHGVPFDGSPCNVPQFRTGQLLRDTVDAMYSGVPERYRMTRDPAGTLSKAPDWLPKEQVNEQNFIAFWGDGQLFKGRQANEYYFIGYRGYVPGVTPQ